MIDAIIFTNLHGDVVFSRFFRNEIKVNIAEIFRLSVVLPSHDSEFRSPVNSVHNFSFLHTRVNDLYIAVVTNKNCDSLVAFEFLYQVVRLLKSYFWGKFNEKKIRGNYPLMHELLEEINDYGYPQLTEIESLKLYITQGKLSTTKLKEETKPKDVTSITTGASPWRPPGIVYKKNQIWIDVVEKIHLLISHTGTILKSEVEGIVKLKINLSGNPQCEFGMNEKLLVEKERAMGKNVKSGPTIALDDLVFHQCVRLNRFETERVVSFVPPDGEFDLMTYRTTERVNIPFRILANVKQVTKTQLAYEVTVVSEYPKTRHGNSVIIKIPTPDSTAVCKTVIKGGGSAKYESSLGGIIWRVKKFPGGHEYILRASVELIATGQDKTWERPPISMEFKVPSFTPSGVKIRYVRVVDKSGYQPRKWVRYVCQGGNYQRRI